MSITNLQILDTTTVGTPSGNYDGSTTDFDSDGVLGVGYYRGQGNLQAVAIRVTGFVGRITIQATLDDNWEDANWVDAYVDDSGALGPITNYSVTSLVGNYTWVRAKVTDFESGTIQAIIISY